MYYIYDMPVANEKIDTIMRFGMKFKLEKKNKMGNQIYYSFVCPGMEKILLVPQFANQYTELEDKVKKMAKGRSYDAYKAVIKKYVTITDEDSYPGDTDDQIIKVIMAEYKDIGVTFEFTDGVFKIADEFEIRENNIFGNNIVVTMHMNDEE